MSDYRTSIRRDGESGFVWRVEIASIILDPPSEYDLDIMRDMCNDFQVLFQSN